jgi:putative 4-mercaptohistidine N1-methyltranferase
MNPYESDKLLNEYLLFHYGADADVLPWAQGPHEALGYAVRCVTECVDASLLGESARALDVGCAVGRSSFELARYCGEVVGIDFSRRFVDAAATLASGGELPYFRVDEGVNGTCLVARRPAGVDGKKVRFLVGDACDLGSELGAFDVVLGANLVDRVPSPLAFLSSLKGLVKQGGQLVLTSPYTWMDEFTPRKNWLGGKDGKTTIEGLREALEPDFALRELRDLPFLIREHGRKFQWSVAQASIWRRI